VRTRFKHHTRNGVTAGKTPDVQFLDILRDCQVIHISERPFDRKTSEIQNEVSNDFEEAISFLNRNVRQIWRGESPWIEPLNRGWQTNR
jgi:hypothetical protein